MGAVQAQREPGAELAEFVWTRWRQAAAVPSRERLGLLMLAVKVAHRRARGILQRGFDDSEDPGFKRELLLTYAALDQQMDQLAAHDQLDEPTSLLAAAASLAQTIEGIFGRVSTGDETDLTRPEPTEHTVRTTAAQAFEDEPTVVRLPRAC